MELHVALVLANQLTAGILGNSVLTLFATFKAYSSFLIFFVLILSHFFIWFHFLVFYIHLLNEQQYFMQVLPDHAVEKCLINLKYSNVMYF